MYHSILLWDMCDLYNLANSTDLLSLQQRKVKWKQVIECALNWLRAILHPDGEIPFFNDSAFGIAPIFADIANYASQLGIITKNVVKEGFSCIWLRQSGYCSVILGEQSKAIIDIAKIGPDYQPGHGHADTLSFELSIYGHRFLVNSGISRYEDGLQRQFERSTQAHNTLTINGENSSEVWSSFRVARRAYPENIVVEQREDNIFIAGSHNGFKRLSGCNTHRREWTFHTNKLNMRDIILGSYNEVESRLYFHPDIRVNIIDEGLVQCSIIGSQFVFIKIMGYLQLDIENTFWYPKLGVKLANHCLRIKLNGPELLTEIKW